MRFNQTLKCIPSGIQERKFCCFLFFYLHTKKIFFCHCFINKSGITSTKRSNQYIYKFYIVIRFEINGVNHRISEKFNLP